ncbi:putative transporter YetK [Brevibacillus reuszeri]|uniref:Permease n=1 Tax=Brevibacillus reuszeri TaxID=54915 RepID=A0A0K9YNY3_9BACL|nr:DMT family transporter [Brevibacillus reuszeri]KNB70381.1 permease [Brevibacillus reuszeri]MED1857910.1 DMT family transporter [Brevibacillus reuszeri]GED71777.1 putative transporter YetK [Brevibacillus reuszeri]
MLLAYVQLALSMAFVGINISIGKEIVSHVPVFLFSELRFLIAILILLPLLASRGEWKASWSREEGTVLFWQSFFGVFLFSICMLYGVKWTSATAAGIITSTVPACIALFSFWLLKEKLQMNNMIAILLSVCGIAFITFTRGAEEQSLLSMLGNTLVFLAVVSEALFTIFAKRLAGKITPFQMTTAINVISFVLFLPFAIWESLHFDWGSVPFSVWGLILYYAITASVLSFFFWYKGVAKVEASKAGLFTGMMPISAALVAIFLLNEIFTRTHAIGMSLVLASIFVGTMRIRRKEVTLQK